MKYSIFKKNINDYFAKPNKTIQEHNNDLIKNIKILEDLKYIDDNYKEKLIICANNHDIGKVIEQTQKRILSKKKMYFEETKEIAHNILSFIFLNPNDFENERDYFLIAYAILNHHAYIENTIEFLMDESNQLFIFKLLKDFDVTKEHIENVTNFLYLNNLIKIATDKEEIILKGLLQKTDYAASGDLKIEFKNDWLENSLNNWSKSNKIIWSDLQECCKENKDNNLINIAPVGSGKTEGMLLWIGNNKGFFFLPLQSSGNAIYERIKHNLLEDKNYEEKCGILHSNLLNVYFNDKNDTNYLKHKDLTKNFALPINISTIDQLFDFVYKYPGYELKCATLSYSKVAIDEIQAYTPDLLAALIYGLHFLNNLGTKINISSATIPPFLLNLLTEPDINGNKIDFKINTFIDDTLVRHNIKTIDDKLNTETIFKGYIKHKGKVLIICNTVKKAQEIYKDLTNKYHLENVHLLHSAFIKKDKLKKEEEILKCGKTSNSDNVIYITTQIVEASLDIDFDYLYTELQDILSFFQRIGRINRKGIKSINDYNCFLFLKINEKLIDYLVDEDIYNLSYQSLKKIDGILLESQKLELINNTLTTENLKNSMYLKKYYQAYKYFSNLNPNEVTKKDAKLRKIDNISFIPYNIYLENQLEIDDLIFQLKTHKHSDSIYIESKQKIESYLVSIAINKLKKSATLIKYLEINEYYKYPLIDCNYNKELGFLSEINDSLIFL